MPTYVKSPSLQSIVVCVNVLFLLFSSKTELQVLFTLNLKKWNLQTNAHTLLFCNFQEDQLGHSLLTLEQLETDEMKKNIEARTQQL